MSRVMPYEAGERAIGAGFIIFREAFPDYAMQFNEDVSVNTLDVDDLEEWRILEVA